MKKKSFSLQKLPEISKQKKDKLNEKNQQFEDKLRGIERLEMHNQLMTLKMKPYETTRTFKKDLDFKSQERTHKIIKILTKHEKFVDLEPIKEVQYQSSKKLMRSTSKLKTPSKKMDIDGYLKQKNDRLIEEELKLVQIENNRRQYLPSIVETEKSTFPYYNETSKKYEEQPFVKLEEKGEKMKIRFLNGFQKWINKSTLKQVHQNEALTLQSYRKVIKNEKQTEVALIDLPENKQIIEKINIDHVFLNRMLTQVYSKKNPRPQIRDLLKEELYINYEESVKEFNKMFIEKREIKRVNRFQRKNKVSSDIKDYIDHHLVCSYKLEFLDLYMLNKTHYISTMVQAYNIIGKLERFQHFTNLYLINNSSNFVEEGVLCASINKYFREQKDKIENIIYSLEEHLNILVRNLYKDIEHIIFLNPRLVGTSYHHDVKIFITSFSEHLSRIIRSVIIHSLNQQLEYLSTFYQEYSNIKKYPLECKQTQASEFNSQVFAINQTFLCQNIKERIIHGPGIIPIVFSLKKWKRKKYNNIFRFIIQCRKNIRTFNHQDWKSFKSEEERIIYKDPLQLLSSIIITPISQYLQQLHAAENVNGCIFNKKIEMIDFVNLQQFSKDVTKLYTHERDEKVRMFAAYFELWELYYMEKPYIDDFIQLYKSIKAIKLIEEEMSYLKQDLELIKSIPSIIEIQFIRLDVTEIKAKIELTILAFIKKILKTCEETLGKMLEYGYEQTIKAKKLNELTPYTNLAEYIDFINFLNKRQVEKSIQKIAENVVFIDSNMSFLQMNRYEIKFALLQRYLESGTWIKKIRASAAENKQKTAVDPFMFLKGVKDKRAKIFAKYNKILKEIIELMKVNDLKNAMRLSALAKNIAHEMKEISIAADEIVKEETLLELEYAPIEAEKIDENRVYRTDLTFFYKEERFLKKYLHFWSYVAKLRTVVDSIHERRVLDVDGIELIRLLREGQELISSIKISTLNKRFLHLCDEVMHQIDPFLKCSKLFLFLASGSEGYRVKVLKELSNQSSSQEMKIDTYNLTIRELMGLPLSSLDWHGVYRIKEEEQIYQSCKLKLNIIYSVIKNLDISIRTMKGVGDMREFELVMVDDNTIRILKQCLDAFKILQEKYSFVFRTRECEEDLMIEASKKINIFYKSITKMKAASEKIIKFYPLFQLVYPSVFTAFEDLNLTPYLIAYENVMIDMTKRADLVKKLTFVTFYDDKVRISYDEDLKKLQEFEIRFYTEMLECFYNKSFFGSSSIEKEDIFLILSSLGLETLNEAACRLMGQWCKSLKLAVQYDNQYLIVLEEVETIYRQRIIVRRRQKLFEVHKYIENQTEKMEIRCGILLLVEYMNTQMSKKIEEQTFQILKLIYEYHYNLKNIFYFYLYINNLYFQSVINALMLVFQLDLSMLYESKYDLNLLLTILQESKLCNPKEKSSFIYTETLTKLIDEFIAVINVLQEKEYCLEDVEKGRVRKMYAYHSLPRLELDNYCAEDNRQWLDDLKQEKEDDFIHNTHLNPGLAQLNLLSLDSSKVEAKEIEKKEVIPNFEEELNIKHMVIENSLHLKSMLRSSRHEKNRMKIVANIAPHLHLKDIVISSKYEIVNRCSSTYYTFDSYRATEFLIQALHANKVLITSVHPNYQLLGRNFMRVTSFLPNYNRDMAIVVYSPKEVLSCLKAIISYERNKLNKFVYIYYDKLRHEEIQSEQVDESCIVFEVAAKLHVNHLLKKQLNFSEKQLFATFVETESHFNLCHPFADSSQKILPPNLLKFTLDAKERDLLTGMIYSYETHRGLSAEVTEQRIMMMAHPVYAIADSHFLINHCFDLGQFLYTKLIKTASNDLNKSIMNELVNVMVNSEQQTLSAYVLPIYEFTREELFTTLQVQSYDQRIQDRYDKELFQTKTILKPYFKRGLLHELIAALSDNADLSEQWNQFRLKGSEEAAVKWFIIDISEDLPVCREVFSFFMQSFANNEYTFANGNHYSTDFHFTQRLIKEHRHKLILIIHPDFLNSYRTDLPPIPIINESIRFDPLREFKVFLATLTKSFPEAYMQLVRIPELLDTFKLLLGCIDLELLSISSIEMMKNIFYIMLNEVRKRELALGHYSESALAPQQSRENLYGAIDLRERSKLQQEHLIELQEIEKTMDLTRREIYKVYTQNMKYQQLLTEQIFQRLENEFQILNPTSYNKAEINQILNISLVFSFYYSIVLSRPDLGKSLSKSLETLTHQPELSHYCFSIQLNRWERWEEIDTYLTRDSCTSDTFSKTLHSKEILRHNLSRFKLQTLKDFTDSMDTIHNHQPPLIQMKGPESYFLKLFILYQFPFRLKLPKSSYPSWVFKYELSLMKEASLAGEPIQEVPESKNKKLARLLGSLKIKEMTLREIKVESRSDLSKWKSVISYKLFRNGEQWYPTQNTSVYFIDQSEVDHDSSHKFKLLKSNIVLCSQSNSQNPYCLLTMIYNLNKFQVLESHLDSVLLSLKTYHTLIEFLDHFRFRQYYLKGLTAHEFQEIWGVKISITDSERYSENRRKMKEVVNKIKLQQAENKSDFTPEELGKIKHFDRISEINEVLSKLISCVEVQRSEITKDYVIRYLLKKPRKYDRIESPDVISPKKRLKSPAKVEFDDILFYDSSYDRSNLQSEDLSQALLFFNISERMLLVQSAGPFDEELKQKYRLGYKCYQKALETMLSSKSTKPFSVDLNRLEGFSINYKEVSIFNRASLQELTEELCESESKSKLRIVTVYNEHVIDELLQLLSRNLVSNIYAPKNHYYILLTPQLQLSYHHGLRTIHQEGRCKGNHLTFLREEKKAKLMFKLQEYTKRRALFELESSNIGQNYIPAAVEKMGDIKIYTSNVRNDLTSKKDVYDQTIQDIDSANKSIQQNTQGIDSNEREIKKLETSLEYWRLKRDFYTGHEEFKEVHRHIKEFQRKRLEKELNRPEYLEDNSYNISYIYAFNILADNGFFPDKALALLEQEYELSKAYQIFEDQKKLFQKHCNYGRLSAMIDNDELVFTDSLITEDHLLATDKLRCKFLYLRHVHDAIFEEQRYDKESPFSLGSILKEELSLIHRRRTSDGEELFNKYIAYIFTHKYIKHITASTIESIEAQLRRAREGIVKMRERIEHEELRFSSNKNYLEQIKSKYEINQRELEACRRNEETFMQSANQNLLTVSEFFFKQLTGISIGYEFSLSNRMDNEEQLRKQGKRTRHEKVREEGATLEIKQEGFIKCINNPQILQSLSEYIIEEMTKLDRRALTNQEKQLLLTVLSRQTIEEIIAAQHIETVPELYESCIAHLVGELFPEESSLHLYAKDEDISRISVSLDYRSFNLILLREYYRTETHYFCKEVEGNYKYEIRGILGRLAHKKQLLDNVLLKFSEKIGLVQAKSSESISRFSLQSETVSGIGELLLNSLKAITNTPAENMYLQGEWTAKNAERWSSYELIIGRIEQKLAQLYRAPPACAMLMYYIRLVGMLAKKSSLEHLEPIIEQVYYDHTPVKERSRKQVKESLLQKRFEAKSEKFISDVPPESPVVDNQLTHRPSCSYISTLDSLLATPNSLILVHGPSLLPKILLVKALRSNKILKRREEILYYVEDNKSKEYWILITISPSLDLPQLLEKISVLKVELALSDENHMKFLLFFQSDAWRSTELDAVQTSIQPIYRFYFENSPASIYYHCSFLFHQYSQRTINTQLAFILSVARYYSLHPTHIPLFHVPLSALSKNQLAELLENTFESFDIHAQSLYYRIVSTLCRDWESISAAASELLLKTEKENLLEYFHLWPEEALFDSISSVASAAPTEQASLLARWLHQIANHVGKESYRKKDNLEKVSFSELMKPQRDEMGFLLEDIETSLSNPYKFIAVNNCFGKLIEKLIARRIKASHPMYLLNREPAREGKEQAYEVLEVTSKKEMFLEILHGAEANALRLNNVMLQVTPKEVSGSIGVFFRLEGGVEEWLRGVFGGELFMVVADKRHKNPNELNYVKGVFFRYSEPIVYVKKEVEFGEEETNVLRPLPQYRNLLPVYASNNQFLGLIELTTNQQLTLTPTLMIRLPS